MNTRPRTADPLSEKCDGDGDGGDDDDDDGGGDDDDRDDDDDDEEEEEAARYARSIHPNTRDRAEYKTSCRKQDIVRLLEQARGPEQASSRVLI